MVEESSRRIPAGGCPVFVVLNPVAGHSVADQIREEVGARLTGGKWQCEIYVTTGKEVVADVAREAWRNGAQLVIAAGGDGTVASVVNGLINSNIPMGIIPVGTGNGLARALGIPLDVTEALDLITGEHEISSVDAMQVGTDYFILNVSAGISARAMQKTPAELKRKYKMAAYAWTILGEALGLNPRRYALTIDGHSLEVRATEILVSNGALFQEPPFPLGPADSFNDGVFDVYLVTARSIPDYLRIIWGVLAPGRHKTDLRHLTVRSSISIQAIRQPQLVQADGEVIGSTPIEVKIAADALQVIVPPKA